MLASQEAYTRALDDLQYGSITVNVPCHIAFVFGTLPWGALAGVGVWVWVWVSVGVCERGCGCGCGCGCGWVWVWVSVCVCECDLYGSHTYISQGTCHMSCHIAVVFGALPVGALSCASACVIVWGCISVCVWVWMWV